MTLYRSPLTGRTKVDLRSLPRPVALLLGATITVGISVAAWIVGRDDPTPPWITDWLVPALGWIYLALCVVALASWWRRRAASRRRER